MSTKNSGNSSLGGGFVSLWTLACVILHFCGIGAFADWPVTAWPPPKEKTKLEDLPKFDLS